MNPLIQLKNAVPVFVVGLVCFGLLPTMRAVSPAPDGGYPGQNTAEGQSALLHLAGGTNNTAIGWASLGFDVTGNLNTAVGAATLLANTADQNTATGAGALLSNTTGTQNTANGALALFNNTEGFLNTATGSFALAGGTTASFNTAMGANALLSNTTGQYNTAIGARALINSIGGDENIALGENAGSGVTSATNVIAIGTAGMNVNDSCYIGNIFNATSSGGAAVFINSNGRLGTATSSRRFKQEIKPMDKTSEALLALKPVSFRYKKGIDPQGIPQFGLVAEEVEKVNPNLIVRDKEGKPYSVRYDQVDAMLLNEFLKEHAAFLTEQRKVEHLEKQVAALTAGLQRVSAQLELNKLAPQTVKNND